MPVTPASGEVSDEAGVAAQWWANCLRDPDQVQHDAGDIEVNAMTSWAREQDSRNDEFDAEKVDEFEEVLAGLLQEKIDDRRWDPQQPFIGTTTVRCDYHADPILKEAADAAGLEISSMTTFPVKTTMRINPGEVSVSAGYSAGPHTIWECGEYLEDIKDNVSGWVRTVHHPETDVEYEYEPKVFPTPDGYLVRAYGEYDPDNWGPAHMDFELPTEVIETHGLETALEQLREKIERWRDDE